VEAIKQLTTSVLQAKAIGGSLEVATPKEVTAAGAQLKKIDDAVEKALDRAGKQERVKKRRLAPVDRISDACDDLEYAVAAVADARATSNFDPADLDETLLVLKSTLEKLSAIVTRGEVGDDNDGVAWLKALGKIDLYDR
jgi:dGTP triphosphohydrolase